jgi:signal transduction histidine kinase
LETQTIVTDKKWFGLDEQIRQSILSLEKRWEDKNISFNIEMDEMKYYGSEVLLSTVWTNIIGNAVKYSGEQSEIDITLEKSDGYAVVTVTDDGIGMSPETLAHIFEKFYQGDLSRRSEGNGLGLTLVKRILDLCGGRAEVKSEPGAGTEFTVYLPVESEA